VMLALIVIVCLVSIQALGTNTDSVFDTTATALGAAS
jgi:hypothetical protein